MSTVVLQKHIIINLFDQNILVSHYISMLANVSQCVKKRAQCSFYQSSQLRRNGLPSPSWFYPNPSHCNPLFYHHVQRIWEKSSSEKRDVESIMMLHNSQSVIIYWRASSYIIQCRKLPIKRMVQSPQSIVCPGIEIHNSEVSCFFRKGPLFVVVLYLYQIYDFLKLKLNSIT